MSARDPFEPNTPLEDAEVEAVMRGVPVSQVLKEKKMADPDKQRGLYRKYFVKRIHENDAHLADEIEAHVRGQYECIPTDTVEKHKNCPYFVLDPIHDIFARRALINYADDCLTSYPDLARGIFDLLRETKGAYLVALSQKNEERRREREESGGDQ